MGRKILVSLLPLLLGVFLRFNPRLFGSRLADSLTELWVFWSALYFFIVWIFFALGQPLKKSVSVAALSALVALIAISAAGFLSSVEHGLRSWLP